MGKPSDDVDRLEQAISGKEVIFTLDDRKITMRKWTLRQSLRVAGKIANIIRQAMPTGNTADLLSADIEAIVEKHEDHFIYVLSVSVANGNFASEKDAQEWVESLSLEDALELFTYVGRLNLRPLMRKLGHLKKVVADEIAAEEKVATQSSEKEPVPQT